MKFEVNTQKKKKKVISNAASTSCHLSEDCGSVKPDKHAGLRTAKREQ